jgi:hypothetical protein
MGQEDARRGCVYWLVEPLYGKHIPWLVQSTHHQEAEALANTQALAGYCLQTGLHKLRADLIVTVSATIETVLRSALIDGLLVFKEQWQRLVIDEGPDLRGVDAAEAACEIDPEIRIGKTSPSQAAC